VEDRAADLLGQMTVDEKLAQLGCVWITALVSGDQFDAAAASRLMAHGMGQVTRIGASTGLDPAGRARLMNQVQRVAVEQTRLGIPVLVHEESTGGFCARDATVFPQALGLAAGWDPDLLEQVAGVIREQMVAVGARQTLAPVLDVARDPRWGRVEETYGEDPVLCGVLGTAYVRGVQGSLVDGVLATGKHFLGYALSEGGRNHAPVQLGPRELREVYAEPFAAAIRDAGLGSIMNSYSSVDGLPCAGAPAVLTGLLRHELGFDGMVVADYFAVRLLMTHHRVAPDKGAAAVLALKAGLDVELPDTDCFGAPLREALDRGDLDMAVVDEAVRRVLRAKLALGLFEKPYVDEGAAAAVYQTPAQRALARQAAAQSVVLLANDGVLPLGPGVRRVAVIGPGADDQRLLQGDYHYPAHLEILTASQAGLPQAGGAFAPGSSYTPHVTPLAGLRAAGRFDVVHALGCQVTGEDRSGFDAAARMAADADVAVVVVAGRSGLTRDCTVGEARDAVSLDLTGVQEELVEAVAATGTPLVVVVLSGRVHTLASVAAHANALLYMAPPGEEGGNGLADVLVGAVDATGRLPVTLPRHVGQVPVFAGHRAGGGKAEFYGDYSDSETSPLFAFGHGLSYTTFAYGPLDVAASDTASPVVVRCQVENTGGRAGVEVVQLWGSDPVASVARPERQLLGFLRLPLEPGERRTVRFEVHPSRLAFYDPDMRFVVEPGQFAFSVGPSHAVVAVAGGVAEYRQRDVVQTAVSVA
jgi:beta-glucosidase